MGKLKTFKDFMQSQSSLANKETVDWNRRRELWLKNLEQLYLQIRDWLRSYKDDYDIIEVLEDVPDIQIQEKFLDAYDAPQLKFKIGRHQFLFQPVGTNIVGAQGRVDLYGPYGKRMLIKPEVGEEKRKWYLVDPNRRSGLQSLFSEETFQKAIVELGTSAIKEEDNDE